MISNTCILFYIQRLIVPFGFQQGQCLLPPSTVINIKTILFERIVDRGCVLCFIEKEFIIDKLDIKYYGEEFTVIVEELQHFQIYLSCFSLGLDLTQNCCILFTILKLSLQESNFLCMVYNICFCFLKFIFIIHIVCSAIYVCALCLVFQCQLWYTEILHTFVCFDYEGNLFSERQFCVKSLSYDSVLTLFVCKCYRLY